MNLNYIFIDSQDKFEKYLPEILGFKKVSLDLETTGLDYFSDSILLLQLGTLEIQYIIDVRYVNIMPLKSWLENKDIIKVVVNGVFDYIFLRTLGIQCEGFVDCYLHELILNAGLVDYKTKGYFSLEGMALRYLGIKLDKETRTEFINFRGEFSEKQLEYAARDIVTPLLILDKQKVKIVQHELQRIVNLENQVLPSYGEMTYNGFYLDKDKWMNLVRWQEEKLYQAKQRLDDIFGSVVGHTLFDEPDINYDSQEQLKPALYKLGYDVADTMHTTLLTQLPYEISSPIIAFREAGKAITSFGLNYLEFINPKTGRLHPKVWQIGAVSGRNAITAPPLQTIKREKEYRECFTTQFPNEVLQTIDYSGQEILLCTQDSMEPVWLKLNQEERNIHLFMGEMIFKHPIEKGSKEYNLVKAVDFSLLYGAGIYKIIMFHKELGLECDEEKAQAILDIVAETIPKAWRSLNNNGANAVIKGYATCMWGRKRFFDNIPPFNATTDRNGLVHITPKNRNNRDHHKILAQIIREGRNHKIQSSGIYMLKTALIYIRQQCKKEKFEVPIVLAVHDEVVSRYPKDKQEIYEPLLINCMLKAEQDLLPDIKPKLESAIAQCWEK